MLRDQKLLRVEHARVVNGIPTMLIFVGVLGGLIAWGFLGIFLGATLLAIGYTVLRSCLDQSPSVATD